MILPSKSQIVKYWYDWGIENRRNKNDKIPRFVERLIIDVGEPFCWGCENYSISWDYINWKNKPKQETFESLFSNWNRLPLERCHIIPRAKGGSNNPQNLILLCEECHVEAPDCIDRRYMMEWLEKRPENWLQEKVSNWKSICKSYDVSPFETMKMYNDILQNHKEEFYQFCYNRSVLHFNSFADATLIACILDFNKMIIGSKNSLE